MWFKMDTSGIKIALRISDYKPSSRDHWDDEWCNSDFRFSSGEWLNYHRENQEVFLSIELEELEKELTALLENKLSEIKEFTCIEPDFVFELYPQIDIRDDPNLVYVRPGFEVQDICLEWKIYFSSDGLTDHYLTITLYRNEIERFRDYLIQVMSS